MPKHTARGYAAFLALSSFAALALGGCPVAKTIIRDATGAICAIVVQATDPTLLPICTTLDEIEAVIAGLVSQHAKAGNGAPYKPSQDDVYQALKVRRATAAVK